ncbi:MAG: DivIVA domain-containing protein [Acidimicrobiaceae bacterium]|nr:DivIVA domain-containing protein [Acidimicrobiia bacterium]MCY4493825.1 DivIVA domain-containing protein [Acidimicrobiaceae bacterium]
MDELSPLLAQVRFHERWRGYDPAEVDAYVDSATRAAVWARSRIETLTERVGTESTRADEPVDPKPGTSAAEEAAKAEEPARALGSDQDAADDAIDEAGQQAKQIVAEAESRVEAMIAGAHAEGTRIRHEADEFAASTLADVENLAREREAAAAAAEREQHASAISELAAQRARQQEDLELFERQVAERRREVETSLSRLVEVFESAEIFRAVREPLNGNSEPVVDDTDSGAATDAVDPEDGAGERVELDGEDSHESESSGPRAEDTDSTAPQADEVPGLDASAVVDDGADSLLSETPSYASGAALGESVETPHGQPRFVTVEDLEQQPARDDGAEPLGVEGAPLRPQLFDETELSSAAVRRREEEPFLAQLREAASRDNIRTDTDDALSAFFNQEEDQRRSPWFLGGR